MFNKKKNNKVNISEVEVFICNRVFSNFTDMFFDFAELFMRLIKTCVNKFGLKHKYKSTYWVATTFRQTSSKFSKVYIFESTYVKIEILCKNFVI